MRLFLYIPVIWAALLIAQSLGGGLPDLFSNLAAALEHPFQIQWTDKSLLTILICTGVYIMGLCIYDAESGRMRDGEEHGSAMWGSPRQVNAQFCQKQNKILTRHVRLGLDTHKHRRSLNVLVIGGSGAAKTRGYVKPNILEANTNYVITDPKMEVLTDTGGYLKKKGYDVRVLNLVNLEQSDGYNPFCYLRDEKDALKLVNTLIQATTPKGSHESDPFWTKSETALLQAIILMLHQEAPEYEQNFSMVMRVLEYAEVREDDDEYISPLDLLFKAMEHEHPESVALRQYKVFKQAAGEARSSVVNCNRETGPVACATVFPASLAAFLALWRSCSSSARSSIFSAAPSGWAVYSCSASRLDTLTLSPVVWLSSVRPSQVMCCVTLSRGFKGSISDHLLAVCSGSARFQSLQYSAGWGTPAGEQLRFPKSLTALPHSPVGR